MNARDECECCGDPGKFIASQRRVLCAECLYELATGRVPPQKPVIRRDSPRDDRDHARWLAEGWWHNVVRAMEG